MENPKKIGLMGGTFNPIHIGHMILAQRAMEEVNLDEVWFIPTGCSYMKMNHPDMLSGKERFQLVSKAIQENDRFRCLDLEVKRQGYTYSYETLEQLKSQYPEYEFYFIFGADCLFSIEKWKCPDRIFQNCTIIAAARNGASLEKMEEKVTWLSTQYGANIQLLSFPNLEISSTEIRNRLHEKKSIRFLVPDTVLSYIEEKHFYQDTVKTD